MSKAAEIAASMYGIGEELEKEATELESQLVTETEEVKPFKMSDYIKPQIINEETETVEEAIEPQEQITEVEEEVIEEAEVDNDVEKQALVLGGTAAAALAGKAIYNKQKQKKTDKVSKVANELLEEAGLTKVANEKNEKVEKIAFAILEEAGFLK